MSTNHSGDDDTDERNTPPLPPSDSYQYESDDAPRGTERVERGTASCPCGGRVDDFKTFTGRMVVDVWPEDFADDYDLESKPNPHFIRFSRCVECGFEVSY